jgi:hypothetical protein
MRSLKDSQAIGSYFPKRMDNTLRLFLKVRSGCSVCRDQEAAHRPGRRDEDDLCQGLEHAPATETGPFQLRRGTREQQTSRARPSRDPAKPAIRMATIRAEKAIRDGAAYIPVSAEDYEDLLSGRYD